MKRTYKILLTIAALSVLASFAWAHGRNGHFGHHEGPAFFQKHATAKIDAALDAAKATQLQRDAIHASLEHVFDTLKDGQEAGGKAIGEAMQLFTADKIDPAAIARHRAQKEAQVQKIGDAVVQFIHDAHDALTAPQRQAVIAFVNQEKAQHENHEFREKMMHAMIQSRIDSVLDEIKATDAQKATVNAAKDRLVAAFKGAHADHGADYEQLITLFGADKLDDAKLTALRADHMQRMKKIADAIVQSITEVHDALSADQRTQLIGIVKAHHNMGNHRG
jgi:Spy/CpxP family protein refolding chaperone